MINEADTKKQVEVAPKTIKSPQPDVDQSPLNTVLPDGRRWVLSNDTETPITHDDDASKSIDSSNNEQLQQTKQQESLDKLLDLQNFEETYQPQQAAKLVREYIYNSGKIEDLQQDEVASHPEVQEGVNLELTRQEAVNIFSSLITSEAVDQEQVVQSILDYVQTHDDSVENLIQESIAQITDLAPQQHEVLKNALIELKNQDDAFGQKVESELLTILDLDQTLPQNLETTIAADKLTVENIEKVEQLDNNELQLTIEQNGEPKKFTIKDAAWIAAFVVIDLALFQGNCTLIMAESTVSALLKDPLQEKTASIFKKLNLDIPENFDSDRRVMYDELMNQMTTRQLTNFLEKLTKSRNNVELYNFLKGMDPREMKKMMSGERFGGGMFGNKHQLEEGQRQIIFNALTKSQVNLLGIDKLA